MKQSFFDRRIPAVVALFLLIIGVGISTAIIQNGTHSTTKAGSSNLPQNVKISNISDTSFTISYTTSAYVPGSLSYGKSKTLGTLALDNRDEKSGNPLNHNVHFITVQRLSPETTYYFVILSGDTTYTNGKDPYQITTGPVITNTPPDQKPITGKLLLPDGSVPKEALVYLSSEKTQPISILINTNGGFIVSLNNIRTLDLSNYVSLTESMKLNLFATDAFNTSNLIFSPLHSNTIPPVVLSQNYDFSSLSPTSTPQSNAGFSVQSLQNTSDTIAIVSPTNNQTFIDNQPVFSGTAPPNTSVTITINPNSIVTAKVITTTNGSWEYRPSTPIAPGNHSITVSATDAAGIEKIFTRNFVIFASGSQVAESATPSASITPTVIPTATASPTTIPSVTPSPLPNVTVSPTAATTITAIPDPSPQTTQIPTPTIVKTGPGNTILGVGAVGIIIGIFGGLLFFAL